MAEHLDLEAIADKYLSAVEQFCEAALAVPADRLDFKPGEKAWSSREVAFHAAEVDQNLGMRLRRLLTEDNPTLAGVNLPGWVELLHKAQLDVRLALDSLRASSALNVALIEALAPAQLTRKGRHSEGHDVTVAGLCVYFALHLESHVKQLARIRRGWQRVQK
ncbi:MAG: DinB family protein [Planctomycetes bacterium]|nr:DinB family protein [Planctomycetota bacterium]